MKMPYFYTKIIHPAKKRTLHLARKTTVHTVKKMLSSSSEEDDSSSSEEGDSSSSEEDDSSSSEEDDSSSSEEDDSSSSEEDDSSSSEEDDSSSSEEDDSSSSEEDDSSSSEEDNSSSSEEDEIYSRKKYYLYFDTETTGLPRNRKAQLKIGDSRPFLVQIAWILSDSKGTIIKKANYVIKPNGFQIPFDSTEIHGITNNFAIQYGFSIKKILQELIILIKKSDYLVAHNMSFDEKTIGAELIRAGFKNLLEKTVKICTMEGSTNYCKIPGRYGYKWPSLSELYFKLFKSHFPESHNAENDINATFK